MRPETVEWYVQIGGVIKERIKETINKRVRSSQGDTVDSGVTRRCMKRGGYISKQLSDHNARQNHKRFMNKGICKKAINGVDAIYIKNRQNLAWNTRLGKVIGGPTIKSIKR